MKVGDLVELSARSLRIKTGGWPSVRDTYKNGLVVEVKEWVGIDNDVTVLWNNGYQRTMSRSALKHVRKSQ